MEFWGDKQKFYSQHFNILVGNRNFIQRKCLQNLVKMWAKCVANVYKNVYKMYTKFGQKSKQKSKVIVKNQFYDKIKLLRII